MTLDEAREHIGHGVVYHERPGAPPEQGVITSVVQNWVFVRYGSDGGSKGTNPRMLTLLAGAPGAKSGQEG